MTKQLYPAFVFLGAPGSGKGTQGRALGSVPQLFHCACGDVFRSLDTTSTLGKKFVEYSSKGELVPDELTVELWSAQIDNWEETHAYRPDVDILLLDGIPRNLEQAEMLREHVEVHGVFHLSCPDRSKLAERMRRRALKENRMDDASEETIQHRIKTYEAETKPILDFYGEDQIINIDAMQAPLKVLNDIVNEIIKTDVWIDRSSRPF